MKKTQTIPLPPKFLEDRVGGVNANPHHKAREQKTFPGSYCWRRRRTALRLAGPCQHKHAPAGSTSSGRARYCWPTADQLSAWTNFHLLLLNYILLGFFHHYFQFGKIFLIQSLCFYIYTVLSGLALPDSKNLSSEWQSAHWISPKFSQTIYF